MIKILISPAKSLNLDKIPDTYEKTEINFKDEAWEIANTLKKLKPKDLQKLMNISEKLADLNWTRNQEYTRDFSLANSKQAIFAFDGEVYNNIDALNLNENEIAYLQNNLRILSGQYGLLKPLDLIMPYRLEMGTKLTINNHKNLYEFWGNKITEELNRELTDKDIVINLASNEYFKAVNKKSLNSRIITPVFKDYKNGKLKTISFFAKKARGLMVNFLAKNNINNDIEKIKLFNYNGYMFNDEISDEKNFVFTR